MSSICQKFLKTSLELYRWQFDMQEIPALFDNCYVRALFVFFLQESQVTTKTAKLSDNEHTMSVFGTFFLNIFSQSPMYKTDGCSADPTYKNASDVMHFPRPEQFIHSRICSTQTIGLVVWRGG